MMPICCCAGAIRSSRRAGLRPADQTAESQASQFGYNNDFIGYHPDRRRRAEHGLLVVNHEYTNEQLMFPGMRQDRRRTAKFVEA